MAVGELAKLRQAQSGAATGWEMSDVSPLHDLTGADLGDILITSKLSRLLLLPRRVAPGQAEGLLQQGLATMFRYTFILLIGLSTAGTAAAGTWADGLFDELTRDFGTVPRGPTLSHPFRVTNKTSAPIHIGSVRVSCGCVTASAMQNLLQPGESSSVFAQMDTRRFNGPKTVTIYVQFTQPQFEEVHLVVQANSRDDVTITPEALAFGQTKRGTAAATSVNLSFLGSDLYRITEVRSESNYVQPTVKEVRREGNEVAYQLTAKLRPDVPVGKWYTDVWVTTNNPATPRIRVPLTVEVESALSVSPATAALGQVKAGGQVERKIIVRGSKPFRITSVRGGDGQLSVQDLPKEPRTVHVLTLNFKPSKMGEQTWNLQVLTDMKEDSEVEFQAKAQVVP